jgi:hypothetical protein
MALFSYDICRLFACLGQPNFMAPDLKEAILEGRQPIELNLENMRLALPLVWAEQRQRFKFL